MRDFQFSADGQTAVYIADQHAFGEFEIFSAPLSGGGSTRLNQQLVGGGGVSEFLFVRDDRIVYLASQDAAGVSELYEVRSDGDGSRKLSIPMVAIGNSVSEEFLSSPDGQFIVYRADQDVDDVFELYSVVITTGLTTKLNGPLAAYGSVQPGFQITPDSSRVIYRADDRFGVAEMYGVSITGGESTKLSDTHGGGVLELLISPDGGRVVYTAAEPSFRDVAIELFNVPIAGGEPAAKLSLGGDVVEFKIAPDSGRVVYTADQEEWHVNELYSVPITGGDIAKLNRPLVRHGDVSRFEFTPDGSQVVYMAQTAMNYDPVAELFVVPIAGGDNVKLSVREGLQIAAGSDHVLQQNKNRGVQLDDPSGDDVVYPSRGGEDGVWDFKITNDGGRVVYLADQKEDPIDEKLYSVAITGGLVTKLSHDGGLDNVTDFQISPDDSLVGYRTSSGSRAALYRVPTAGGRVTQLSDPQTLVWREIEFTPDSKQLVYRAEGNLHIASVTGGEDPIRADIGVSGFMISHGGESVVYRADRGTGKFELYRWALRDGGSTKLNDPLAASADVSNVFEIIPEGNRVVFVADKDIDDQFGLYVRTEVLGVRLVPGTAGIALEFDGEFQASVLNLFDAQSVGMGSSDLVLEGSTSGIVMGSLVLGPSLRGATFIKSGGPLAADTYTVRLRGGTDGIRSPIGAPLLAGDADTSAGIDFSGSFTVSANDRVVALPDFARGPGKFVNVPANTNEGIPLTISDGEGIRSATLRIEHDPALLLIVDAAVGSAMPTGSAVTLDRSIPGSAMITFTSPTDVPAGENVLLHLRAIVPAELAAGDYGRPQIVQIESVTLTDANQNLLSAVGDKALHVAAFLGDVTGNGRINAFDASRVARVAAELDSGFAANPLIDPRIMADISGNGVINASDASQLLQLALESGVSNIPAAFYGERATDSISRPPTTRPADVPKLQIDPVTARTHAAERPGASGLSYQDVDIAMSEIGNLVLEEPEALGEELEASVEELLRQDL